MSIDPVIYADGKSFYKELEKKYIKHARGLFILAPSGAGKTYFCNNQTESHWIDGDELWTGSGAQPIPETQWWTQGLDVINRVDQRSDVVTMEANLLGFWIMGASCYWYKPDAVVIPDWETHTSYIKHREENNYDGGAKSDALDQVLNHIESIKKWHTKHSVPIFNSIDQAVEQLTKKL